MTKLLSQRWYNFLSPIARGILRIFHPVIKVKGLENIPQGPSVLCVNHSGLLDPGWVVVWCRLDKLPRTMAKKELFRSKFMSRILSKIGAFPVDREGSDISAIKTAFQTLKEGNRLLIFPEGTRIRKGKTSQPHSGAALIASRMHVPLVPIYLSNKRFIFSPVHLIVGEPIDLEFAGSKPTAQELQDRSDAMMKQIYRMGEQL